MVYDIFINIVIKICGIFIKRKTNYIALGAWCGDTYNDNSKYLMEYIINSPELSNYHVIWVGKKHIKELLPNQVDFVEINTLKSGIVLLKCKYMFFCQMSSADISKYNVFKNATLVFLDHGIPIKKWAMDVNGYAGELEEKNQPLKRRLINTFFGNNVKYDYFICSSYLHKDTYLSALKHKGSAQASYIYSGTPRNDILFIKSKEEIKLIKGKYSKLLGFDNNKKILLYLPTFRLKEEKIESFFDRTPEELSRLTALLSKYNAVILEKNHFAANKFSCNQYLGTIENIIKVNIPVDLQELMLCSDCQIGDYSGSILDYLIVNRPIIHYAYDYEYYKNYDSGLYYPIEDFFCGPIVNNFNDLLKEINKVLEGVDEFKERRESMKSKYIPFETGSASKIICDKILQ